MKSPIFGQSYVSRSPNLAADRLLNLYSEAVETRQGREIGALYLCPGLTLLASLGVGPIRASHQLGNLLWVVSGQELYQVNSNFVGATTSIATQVDVATGGNGTASYTPLDVLTLTGGTGIEPTVTVANTQIDPSISIVNGGAGGTPGLTTFTSVTGTGAPFTFTGTISGGGILTGALTAVNRGTFTVNPLDPNIVPITGGGLIGGTVKVIMRVKTATLTTPGALTIKLANPASVTGGTGFEATLTMTYTDTAIADGAVQMVDNGKQLLIVAGANGYVYDPTKGFVSVTLPFTSSGGTITAAQQDGYALINEPGSYTFFQSDLLDFTTWGALNFGSASGDGDNIIAVVQLDREIWLIKQQATEIWYNAGTSGLAFARLDGVYIESGCAAARSPVRVGESLCWLSQNKSGQGIVVRTNGHRVERISTFAVEYALSQYAGITDAIGYTYQQAGHEFYVLNFPNADKTWVFDATMSALLKAPQWHERASLANGLYHRHWADNQTNFSGKNVVGDYRNGNIYAFDLNQATDNGTARKWLRVWRALQESTLDPTRFSELVITMQTGMAVVTENPQIMLRWSDDGAHNWSSERFASVGKIGETAHRVKFNRLGSTRRNTGLDRVFELSSTDQFPAAIIGADLR